MIFQIYVGFLWKILAYHSHLQPRLLSGWNNIFLAVLPQTADFCHNLNAFLNCVEYKQCILIAQS